MGEVLNAVAMKPIEVVRSEQNKMRGLQSENMPLRSAAEFYHPTIKEKLTTGIKVFPQRLQPKPDILTPKGNAESILHYLSGLNGARQLPRRVGNRQDNLPSISRCRRHELRHKIINCIDEFATVVPVGSETQRTQTYVSTHRSNLSSIEAEVKKLREKRRELQQSGSSANLGEGEREMRFSFYNTVEKSDYFTHRFRQDSSLEERKTSRFQNMVNRTITSQHIVQLLQQHTHKLKRGLP